MTELVWDTEIYTFVLALQALHAPSSRLPSLCCSPVPVCCMQRRSVCLLERLVLRRVLRQLHCPAAAFAVPSAPASWQADAGNVLRQAWQESQCHRSRLHAGWAACGSRPFTAVPQETYEQHQQPQQEQQQNMYHQPQPQHSSWGPQQQYAEHPLPAKAYYLGEKRGNNPCLMKLLATEASDMREAMSLMSCASWTAAGKHLNTTGLAQAASQAKYPVIHLKNGVIISAAARREKNPLREGQCLTVSLLQCSSAQAGLAGNGQAQASSPSAAKRKPHCLHCLAVASASRGGEEGVAQPFHCTCS